MLLLLLLLCVCVCVCVYVCACWCAVVPGLNPEVSTVSAVRDPGSERTCPSQSPEVGAVCLHC